MGSAGSNTPIRESPIIRRQGGIIQNSPLIRQQRKRKAPEPELQFTDVTFYS